MLAGGAVQTGSATNWGNPTSNFDSGSFGRITSLAGDSRIMQFAIKYGF